MFAYWHFVTLVILLVLGGCSLLAWALFTDRPRGRKHCPKCWYSMEGATNLLCPECGHEARSPSHLLKTRRRRKPAAAAMASILLGLGLGGTLVLGNQHIVQQFSWGALLPATSLLIAHEYTHAEWVVEGLSAHSHMRMWKWQQRWLARASVSRLDDQQLHPDARRGYHSLLSDLASYTAYEPIRRRAVQAIAEDLVHENQDIRRSAIYQSVDWHDIDASITRLRPLLDHEDEHTRTAVVGALQMIVPAGHAEAVDPVLRECLSHECEAVRGFAAHVTYRMSARGVLMEDSADVLKDMADDPNPVVQEARVQLLAFLRPDEETWPKIESAWASDDPGRRRGAVFAMKEAPLNPQAGLPIALEALDHEDAEIRKTAGRYVGRFTRTDLEALREHKARFESLLGHDDIFVHRTASSVLHALNR